MTAGAERLSVALTDRYRIEREIGAGGMATVYLAHDEKHDRKVALKVLRPELAAIIGAERFLAEIRTTANLQHPHILPLFDSGAADGFLFYVMPFIEGETVRVRLTREKQLPVADALRIATEVAGALDYAHRHGVIHRDIKPENILLHDGSALVADFGIALAASRAGGTRMTETGMSLGTPHYMSPEQAMGEREITARSDVYAIGAVTYEMLLGEPPFTGPTAQSIVAKVLSERPAGLTARRERIPAQVESAVLTALEKLPADRFATAVEFASALRAPAVVAPTLSSERRVRSIDWRAAAVGGLLVGAIAATAVLKSRTDAGESAAAGARSQLTFNGRNASPAISPDGEYLAFLDWRCPRGWSNPCEGSLLVQGRGSDRPVNILRGIHAAEAPRFTHDGASLVVSATLDSSRRGLFVIPRLGGVPRQIGPAGPFDTHASGDSVAVVGRVSRTSKTHAFIFAHGSNVPSDSVVLPDGSIDAIGWSPDGRLLALVEYYAKLTIVRRDGTVVDSLRGPFRPTVRWTPDGSGVLIFRALPVKEDDFDYYAVDGEGRLTKRPVVRVSAIQTLLRGEFDVARSTGQLALVTGGINFDLWTFDLGPSAGPPRRRTSGTTYYSGASLTPDGKRLIYQRGDASGDNLYSLDESDVEEALTAERAPAAGTPVISRDGHRAFFGFVTDTGLRFGLMDLATRRTTPFTTSGVNPDAVQLTSARVVFLATAARALHVTEIVGGQHRVVTLPDSITPRGLAISPSGDSVALTVIAPSGMHLVVTPLTAWVPRWLHRFRSDETTRTLSWTNDGDIYFWLWPTGDDAPGAWRIPFRGGAPVRARTLPVACNNTALVVAVAAPRGACEAIDERGDVWLLRVPGVTR